MTRTTISWSSTRTWTRRRTRKPNSERGLPKYERAALRWLERFLAESSPTLKNFAEATANLAKLGAEQAFARGGGHKGVWASHPFGGDSPRLRWAVTSCRDAVVDGAGEGSCGEDAQDETAT
jgi:hypothetical protein